jgi:glutamyl-tRNA reductase
MNLVLVGVSHKTAPVGIREKVYFDDAKLPEALQNLTAQYAFSESMILSTCNRVEVVAYGLEVEEGIQRAKDFLCNYHHLPSDQLQDYLYGFVQVDAVRHIFRVAASLDSMVLGEPQILGQIKNAYNCAQTAGTVGKTLNHVMNRAFSVAKRIRTETGIAGAAVSISYAAVELAKKIFNDLSGKTVLILGAGKMSELAAKHLTSSGISHVMVWNRTYQRAIELARVFEGEAIRPEDLFRHIERADIIISSTGSPAFILNRLDGERIIRLRKSRPVFIIDIAVPRDVDPEINKVNNVFLYDIDDLRNVIDANLKQRQKEAVFAEEIIQEEVASYLSHSRVMDVTPTIVSLRQHWERVAQEEVSRNRKYLGSLSPDQEAAVNNLAQSILNKVLHVPIAEMKTLSQDPTKSDQIEFIKRLLGLRER